MEGVQTQDLRSGSSIAYQEISDSNLSYLLLILKESTSKQECIPVGCVPTAAVVISGGGGGFCILESPVSSNPPPSDQTPNPLSPSRHPPPLSGHPPGFLIRFLTHNTEDL